MPDTMLLDAAGAEKDRVELPESLFAAPVNEALVHQALVRQLASRRLGNADTQTRAEVSGGGHKPWRQKGTGRARHGSRRSPIWTGGGVVFGPHPRSYDQRMPAKMRRAALRSVLSAKQADGAVKVVEGFDLDAIRTRLLLERLEAWKATGRVLLVAAERDERLELASRNLHQVHVLLADSLNVVDLLEADTIVFTRDALAKAEEVYA